MFVGELTVMIMGAGSFDRVGMILLSSFLIAFRYSIPRMLFGSPENSSEGGILCVSETARMRAADRKVRSSVLFQKKTVFCRSFKRMSATRSRASRSLHSLPKQRQSTIPRPFRRDTAPVAKYSALPEA